MSDFRSIKDNADEGVPVLIQCLNTVSAKAEKNYVWLFTLQEEINKYGFDFIQKRKPTVDDPSKVEAMSVRTIKLFINKAKEHLALNVAKETGQDLEEARKFIKDKVNLKKVESVPEISLNATVKSNIKGDDKSVLGFLNGLSTKDE